MPLILPTLLANESLTSVGLWEINSVPGSKSKDDDALLTLVERKTQYMITIVLDDHTKESVRYALKELVKAFGQALFPQVFKSIASDIGSELSSLDDTLKHLSDIYFSHPHSSWKKRDKRMT